MGILRDNLPLRTFAVVTGYEDNGISAQVAAVQINNDDSLSLTFRKGHSFTNGQALTVHLDNRTGAESFDADIRVYRSSYKGQVSSTTASEIQVAPVAYQLFYSTRMVGEFRLPGYTYPKETRAELLLEPSTLDKVRLPDSKEHENKLGVLVTRAPERPHTTVMAFLSSDVDDVFLVSHPESFKSHNLHRDGRCCFAIDHRATYLFEKAIEWNFTILDAQALLVPRTSEIFSEIQAQFIEKNPWELVFFSDPAMEMYHLKPLRIQCSWK